MIINLKSLIAKLNNFCKKSLESAAGMCLSMNQYNVEIEHWLLKMMDDTNSDISLIFKHFMVDRSKLEKDLLRNIESFSTGNTRAPAISDHVVTLCREAWLMTSLDYDLSQLRSGELLLTLLKDDVLARIANSVSREFEKISTEQLTKNIFQIIATSIENTTDVKNSAPENRSETQNKALNQFTIDLTAQARSGKIDPVLERDVEIRQLIDILMRRRQNNPILTGEAGVGKTSVVEGFALRIAQGDVPPSLRNVAILQLDLGLLQAGAGVKGEFENRLKSVIREVKESAQPIILFIDEAHTLIGAGGAQGQGDAANLLKPALARGELRTIAATTWSEYKKYFEQDPALTRRFQVVKVEEPSEESAIIMLQGILATLEKHHGVKILSEAVEEAVHLSHRFLPGRQLPDKAVSLLDTACARVAISLYDTPASIENCLRQLAYLDTERKARLREKNYGVAQEEALLKISNEELIIQENLEKLQTQWKKESEIITQLTTLRAELDELTTSDETNVNSKKEKIAVLTSQLTALQNESPLMQSWVDKQSVAEVISGWTGIPTGRMTSNQIQNIIHLQETLENRIMGQSHALQKVTESIKTSRAKLTDPRKPIGVFLFVGTSGVGKTETAMALAETLYGGEQNLTVINMSEFKEEHKVSTLVGAPPGYVGYGQGGVLTEAVRRKPYSLVLLDEIEKAHPNIQDVFYQVFDKGILRDSEGRDVSFKNTIIILTSNACTDLIASRCANSKTRPSIDELKDELMPELLKTFKPAFLGRVQIIPFYPLNDETMHQIICLQLNRVAKRIKENQGAIVTYDDSLVNFIASRCHQLDTGARSIEHLLNSTILPELSTKFLTSMLDGNTIEEIKIETDQTKFLYKIKFSNTENEVKKITDTASAI